MKPRIAIMGTGAVGGYVGAHMARAGEDIVFIDPWPDHVERMRSHGLSITHLTGEDEFTTGPLGRGTVLCSPSSRAHARVAPDLHET